MKQIIFIRGGEVFANQEDYYAYLQKREYNPFHQWKPWRDRIVRAMSTDYETIVPDMPNKQNADYKSRKIRFEKSFPYLNEEETIMIGNSLWSSFLIKRLSENTFPKKISQLHLVCPVFDDTGLDGEVLGDFKAAPENYSNLEKQVERIFIYHSKDDHMVPFYHSEKVKSYLPKAMLYAFEKRGHFDQPALPELLENINYYKKFV